MFQGPFVLVAVLCAGVALWSLVVDRMLKRKAE
jgi:hypothetical protein